ncbi:MULTISPECIES: enoyl-CoA hydratase/isomerase family protein [Streptomyces]|uniref:enoyl-CoA hydratase/isomerase family protein n=1 Tax=Streptomyces TaxID=1883 RepID=UPI0022559560|nr:MULTISPECIES: enoyl-CoA hydratase/isomerase family protein [Streptomyces]MCX5059127.1 enoyl-CoA hydratase/isomerase family protein [Streptomyces sp. NBC_00452]MCZ4506684.1 enoyl-CoA hydratase/isomerase family protein [Streptomyces sp. ActVer]WSS99422.1 enoyl-CoA hydratase/isomerase family protein [Streptomyces phaeochromogenes]
MVDDSSLSDVEVSESERIINVTFCRDAKLNAITPAMFDALDAAVIQLEQRADLRVLVIRGRGRYFTAGIDILTVGATVDPGGDASRSGYDFRRRYRADARHDLFDRLEMVEKPVILAANGPCMGIGVEMAVSCDFRLASEAASFRLPEVAKLAMIPGSGGISRLTRLLGTHWAKWLVMTDALVDASAATDIGLVHAVYPSETFDRDVDEFARKLAALPAEALGLAKLAIDAASEVDRRTARDIDRLAQTMLIQSESLRP